MSTEQIDNIKNIWVDKAIDMGYLAAATLMSSLYPSEFEAYMLAFELCDSMGNTLDFFTFPIMPNELSIDENIPVKTDVTFGGVSSVSSNIYIPKKISLRGSFGRKFKVLLRDGAYVPPIAGKEVLERDYGIGGIKNEVLHLSRYLKTGFGCFKVLQSICNQSVAIDEVTGECNRLYMYNLAYGESYLVKVINFKGRQDISSNGLWNYDLSLEAVCPLHLDKKAALKAKAKMYAMMAGQAALNSALGGIKSTLNAIHF